ncbi:MAG: iron export ABC transporter permease subunit FetB [Elainella sp. Prado103]|jgi:putative ABC transport system permease protein|nr:iron export ABC transporter permease subunit FetB [Elainella sp. Prado103]
MTTSYIPITYWQLALASALILINIGLSFVLQLGLAKQLGIAAFRMTAQLLLVGYVLKWVFTLQQPGLVLLVALLMSLIAGQAATDRVNRRFVNIYGSCFLSILISSIFATGLTVEGIIQVHPWYNPQYVIPMLGMVLGNALTGTSLALERFTDDLINRREQVESLLALGATRWEATQGLIQVAIRTGMTPTINQMMVMGIVSLPGMMTGQILAGALPTDAVRYQIVILFTIAAGTALSTMSIVLIAFRVLLNAQHQLQVEQLQLRQKAPSN